jgi:hypothetical protein
MANMDLDFSTTNNVSYTRGLGKRGEGICMCWTSNWAKKVLRLGRKLKSKSEIGNELAIGAQHSGINVGLSTGRMKGAWYDEVFARQNLSGKLVKEGDFSESFMNEVLKAKGCYYFYIRGPQGAHAMGFWRGTVYNAFFDPNFGQYSCVRDSTFRTFVPKHVNDTYAGQCDESWAVWLLT